MSATFLDTIEAIVEPDALAVSFQPIYEIRGSTKKSVILEGLTRGKRGTKFEKANALFETVRRLRPLPGRGRGQSAAAY